MSATVHAEKHAADAEHWLAHHFDDIDQQHASAVLGMWTFLATEVMFFGGLFAAYTVFRALSPWEFVLGSRHLSVVAGGINTAVLLVSSLAVAMAVHETQSGRPAKAVSYLIATMILGVSFLGIKSVEYYWEYEEHLVPGLNYQYHQSDLEKLEKISEETGYQARPERLQMFAVLYFFMTGLHAIHMIIGIVAIGIIAYWLGRGVLPGGGRHHVEIMGLYWHFIDVVWVFLYPLLYLIDIHK